MSWAIRVFGSPIMVCEINEYASRLPAAMAARAARIANGIVRHLANRRLKAAAQSEIAELFA